MSNTAAKRKVIFVSCEGYEFVVERRAAMASPPLRDLLVRCDYDWNTEEASYRIRLPNVSSATLESLVQQLCHHYQDDE